MFVHEKKSSIIVGMYFCYLWQDVSNLQEAKQLLISQKLELQSQLGEKETNMNKVSAELEETKEVAKKVQNMLREEAAALQNKLVGLLLTYVTALPMFM